MTSHPIPTKRIGEYDPETQQYPAFVAIDGEPEQLVGVRWSAGAADRCADEYIFQYYIDNHTPEAAARIALAFEPEPGPSVDNGPEDNFGGFRGPALTSRSCRTCGASFRTATGRDRCMSCIAPAWFPRTATCSVPGCTRPATRPGLIPEMPLCDACDAAALERLLRAIFEPGAELNEAT